ncbi:MAG: hypothetical protein JW967_05530 [Dehalococcoidales bacterium]|nr:hypothetical protein [Dehalococcoidales bacterium]
MGKFGLIYNTEIMGRDPSWLLDDTSVESFGSSWNKFGYEIVFRPQEIQASASTIERLQHTFMNPFDLPLNHFKFEPTFWYVFWDKGQLRVNAIKECEKGIDRVARDANISFILHDVIIQPRPMGYIEQMIESNNKIK